MVIKFDKVLDDIKIADYNNRKIVLSTQKGEPIRFQIPKMYMPFGISGFTPEIGNKKWNIDFSMRGYDETDSVIKRCYDVLRQIEEKIITNVAEQSEDIFGKKMTYEEFSTTAKNCKRIASKLLLGNCGLDMSLLMVSRTSTSLQMKSLNYQN